jgi:hypothetical protein
MANSNGALTSSQGTKTLDCSANDTIVITPTAGSFTLEYPIGAVLASGVSATATYNLGPGQCRLTCISGSIAYALTDNVDSAALSQSQLLSVQSLVSGATSFPAAKAAELGADASYLSILGTYISIYNNMPVSPAALAAAPYANAVNNSHCYVDPVTGNDANSGFSPSAPKKTLVTSGWTGGTTAFNPYMFMLLKRGSSFDLTSPLGGGSGMSGAMSVGSYGDPALPRPILRPKPGAVYLEAGLHWTDPSAAYLVDMDIDCSGIDSNSTSSHGVRLYCQTNIGVMQNVNVSNTRIRAPRTTTGKWPAGITVHKRTTESSSTAATRAGYVRIEGCEIFGGGAHGIQLLGALGYQDAAGNWTGADITGNYVHDCGLDYDAHAITSVSDAAYSGINVVWTNSATNIYYCVYSTVMGRSVGGVDLVNLISNNGDGCIHNFTVTAGAATAPALGEFGFDPTTQRLYIGYGYVPVLADQLISATLPPRGVLYANNVCENMILQNNTSYTEGAGLQFDDCTSDSMMIGNIVRNCAGAGYAINHGQKNRIVRNFADNNGRCAIGINGHGNRVEANVVRGGSTRGVGFRGLIVQDMVNGPMGSLITQVRGNLIVATSQLDAYIMQSDTSGYRGNFTVAGGNRGMGPALTQTIGKVLGF